jgi:hypothetical protein
LQLAQSNLAIKIAIFPTILRYSGEQNIRFDCKRTIALYLRNDISEWPALVKFLMEQPERLPIILEAINGRLAL